MAYQSRVSEAVIRRLPVYYRYLRELEKKGVERVSSRKLSEKMNFTASQIRQDINCFGGFGQQGYGYHVTSLRKHLESILGLEKMHTAVLVGAGNIGRALAGYQGFEQDNVVIQAVFDKDPNVIGMRCNRFEVRAFDELENYLLANHVDIGVIAVPAGEAQNVADHLIAGGVKAIWNFAPTDVQHPDTVVSTHVHLTDSLHILTYMMNEDELFRRIEAREKIGNKGYGDNMMNMPAISLQKGNE